MVKRIIIDESKFSKLTIPIVKSWNHSFLYPQ